jgi:putative transposase
MPRKSHQPVEIVDKLRPFDVLTSQGQSVAEAIRAIEVSYRPATGVVFTFSR